MIAKILPAKELARLFITVITALATSAVSAGEIPKAVPEDVGMSTEKLQNINTMMQRHIDAGDIQGGVTAVARRGRFVHFEAHGLIDADKGLPMPKDAIFRMASSTKPVLGVAAMMMIEQGLIHPSDPVSKYIPEFKDMQVAVLKEPADKDISPLYIPRGDKVPEHRLVPAERPVTIHHLLTHTSGLRSSGLGSAVAGSGSWRRAPEATLASTIPMHGEAPLDFQPGTRWSYSPGTGLDVVARIIEIVSNTPFDVFLQERIFNPLGMKDTHFNVPPEKASRRVVIQGRDMSRWKGRGPTKYFSASGGLSSTAEDYLRFEQMLAGKGMLFGNRLISPQSVETMASNHVGDLYTGLRRNEAGVGFGYTVAITLDTAATQGTRSSGTFGWGGAHGTRSWTDPARELTGVIMLQQPHQATLNELEFAVSQAIIE
jgi:CubicO group peptidase (beta-lactamase class C family)